MVRGSTSGTAGCAKGSLFTRGAVVFQSQLLLVSKMTGQGLTVVFFFFHFIHSGLTSPPHPSQDGDDSKGVCDDCEGDEVWGSEESNSPEISVAPASVPPAAPAASAPAVDEVMSDDSDSNDSDLIKECGQCGFQYKNVCHWPHPPPPPPPHLPPPTADTAKVLTRRLLLLLQGKGRA